MLGHDHGRDCGGLLMGPRGRPDSPESGFTLPELLVSITVGLVVLGAALTILQSSTQQQVRQSDRAADIQSARVMIERLTREVRQGSDVLVATPSKISFVTFVDSATCGGASAKEAIECRVTYSCGGNVCTREETDPAVEPSGGGVQIVEGIRSTSVFGFAPDPSNPTFVEITLELGEEQETVTVAGGATLRNSVLS